MHGLPDPALRREYHRRIWRVLRVRRDPGILLFYVLKCAMHYHAHSMAKADGHRPGPDRQFVLRLAHRL